MRILDVCNSNFCCSDTSYDFVTIGNGFGVSIKHIGFATYTDSSSTNLFSPNQLLHVSHIT